MGYVCTKREREEVVCLLGGKEEEREKKNVLFIRSYNIILHIL
jgi:hypothetical protein